MRFLFSKKNTQLAAIITLLIVVGGDASAACKDVLLNRALGLEWELGDIRRERVITEADGTKPLRYILLERSKIQDLYGFFGRAESENPNSPWIRNFLPQRVAEHPEVINELARLGLRIEQGVLTGLQRLSGQDIHSLVKTLFEARGKFSRDLRLRKVPEAWLPKVGEVLTKEQHALDDLIAMELAEEWMIDASGNNVFLTVEFPSERPFTNREELVAYLQHFVARLELLPPEKNTQINVLRWLAGHIHHTFDIAQVDDRYVRETYYRSLVRMWGDLNDLDIVSYLNLMSIGSDYLSGELPLTRSQFVSLAEQLEGMFQNRTFSILTREMYERLDITDRGVVVRERDKGLDPFFDVNFPVVYKRLSYGFRGNYGQATVPAGEPVPLVGIEARGHRAFGDAIASVPEMAAKILDHDQAGPRGLLSDSDLLRRKASELGIDSDFMVDAEHVLAQGTYRWTPEQVRAMVFLPLNDWLKHPLAKKNLQAMGSYTRVRAEANFEVALSRYVVRMNELANARKRLEYIYRPWKNYVRERLGDFNIVNRSHQYMDLERANSGYSYAEYADDWFRKVLILESARFVSEAQLAAMLGAKDDSE